MSEGRFNLQSPASDPQGQRLKHVLFSPRLESLLEIEEYMFWIFFKDKERIFFFFLRFYLFIFGERGREEERGKHQCVVASPIPPTGDLARNPGMCPDSESNRRCPFGSQASAQSTEELHQPGLFGIFFKCVFCFVLFGALLLGKERNKNPEITLQSI